MASLQGQRIHETACTPVVVCLETLELSRLLTVRTGDGLTGGIAREAVQASIHCEGLQPILRRQELYIEACLASQLLRYGLVQIDGNLHGLALGCDDDTAVEVVVIVTHGNFDTAVLTIHLPAGHLRHKIPLFGRIVQADGSTLYGTHTMMNDFNAGVLLVIETTIKTVTEY